MGNYDDIINLPHHVSETHPPMSRADRAAQFSPFAALTGYDAAVRETARVTQRRVELEEGVKAELNARLHQILEHLPEQPQVSFTYFVPDKRKEGGAYCTATGIVRKMDSVTRTITLTDGRNIPIEELVGIEGELFP